MTPVEAVALRELLDEATAQAYMLQALTERAYKALHVSHRATRLDAIARDCDGYATHCARGLAALKVEVAATAFERQADALAAELRSALNSPPAELADTVAESVADTPGDPT